jgi:hypothetical protein
MLVKLDVVEIFAVQSLTRSSMNHLVYISSSGCGVVEGTFQQITIPQEDVRLQHHPILYPLLIPLDGPFYPEL